jgi:hypothetical protein
VIRIHAVDDAGKDENFAVDDARKDENFAVDDVRKDEDLAVDDVGKDDNFVENAVVLSDARHEASAEHTQPDIPIETGSALSRTPILVSDRWTFEDEVTTVQMMILFPLRRV